MRPVRIHMNDYFWPICHRVWRSDEMDGGGNPPPRRVICDLLRCPISSHTLTGQSESCPEVMNCDVNVRHRFRHGGDVNIHIVLVRGVDRGATGSGPG